MDSTPLRNSMTLQAALATAFCYLISGMDDINVHVSQRATLYLGTIHDRAMKVREEVFGDFYPPRIQIACPYTKFIFSVPHHVS